MYRISNLSIRLAYQYLRQKKRVTSSWSHLKYTRKSLVAYMYINIYSNDWFVKTVLNSVITHLNRLKFRERVPIYWYWFASNQHDHHARGQRFPFHPHLASRADEARCLPSNPTRPELMHQLELLEVGISPACGTVQWSMSTGWGVVFFFFGGFAHHCFLLLIALCARSSCVKVKTRKQKNCCV